MAEILFDIEELSDASGFEVIPGEYTATNDVVIAWTSTGNFSGELPLSAAEFNEGYTYEDTPGAFIDGVYSFTATSGDDTGSRTEGFVAIITDRTIKEALTYRIYLTKAQKDWINEKMRLLNNIRYAAAVGASDKFVENLEVLQRMR